MTKIITGGLTNTGTATNKKQTVSRPNTDLTNKIILYAFNYERDFLLKAFRGHGSIAQHFQSKFNGYYERFGNGERAFLYLWTDMSNDWRVILAGYINDNFKG